MNHASAPSAASPAGSVDRSPIPAGRALPPATGGFLDGMAPGHRQFAKLVQGRPYHLEGGGSLPEVVMAYETWGRLSPERDNAVLVCHALTGDSHVAGPSSNEHPTPGWWDQLVGPGKCLDTDRFFVVCSNVIGGCQGSTGPASTDPTTSQPYGGQFPVVTIRDMVRAQAMLSDALGVQRWALVVGGSMGGMQVLEWSIMYPHRVAAIATFASTEAASAQQIAWSLAGRAAIEADTNFRAGEYYGAAPGDGPHRGLAAARIVGQVTYRSEEVYANRFDRQRKGSGAGFGLGTEFEVESYLRYHGDKFVRRFDANSYIRLNRAMDLHDVGRGRNGAIPALGRVVCPVLLASVTSDALYPPYQQEQLVAHLRSLGVPTDYFEIDSPDGHDGFLLAADQIQGPLAAFLANPTAATAASPSIFSLS
jgi:homoserine O-acetyltransferase